VVVEPVQDLDLAPVGQAPVGEVGLPQLVGRGRLEPDPRAARALARLGHDEAGRVQDPPDGRGRRGRHALAPQVPGDRDGTGVETAPGELGAQRDDPRAHDVGHPPRAGVRPARSRLDGVKATISVPAEQALEVLPADPVLGRGGGDGQLFGDDLEDGHPMLRHARDCRRCPDSPVTYHVSPMS